MKQGETPLFVIPKTYSKNKPFKNVNVEPNPTSNSNNDDNSLSNSLKSTIDDSNKDSDKINRVETNFNYEDNQKNLVKCPGGNLDLSHYEFAPKDSVELTTALANELSNNLDPDVIEAMVTEESEKPKKIKIFRRPNQNSRIARVISFLEDRRIKEDSELYQLEDLKMPKLRKFLNIIFVSFGVFFLVGVVIVIIYTGIWP